MRTHALIFISLFLLIALNFLISCGNSTGPDVDHIFPDPIDSVAQNITLSIYSSAYDSFLAEIPLGSEGIFVIDLPDSSVGAHTSLNVYARAEGFYTEVLEGENGDTLIIDLDAVPDALNSITGVIIEESSMLGHCYCANRTISVVNLNGYGCESTTDDQGRYGLKNLPQGAYSLVVQLPDTLIFFEIQNTYDTDYNDLSYEDILYIWAPYIYLCPEEQTDISVNLQFLQGGGVTESEPPYGDGWHVNVTPDGTIDGQYNYLFYEGKLPHLPTPESGWLISGDNLSGNISELLSSLGFNENETDDFTDFWVPVIEGSPYYAFFYLDPDSIISLDIPPEPANILRVFFVIKSLDRPISLTEPELTDNFSRAGFAAVEWGVIGWQDK